MNCKECPYQDCRSISGFCQFHSKAPEEDSLPDCCLLDHRYLLKYMCSGGSSYIYRAYDLQTSKIVAVKECYIKGCYYGRDQVTGLLMPIPSKADHLSGKLKLFVKESEKLNELDFIVLFPKMYQILQPDEYNIFLIMELLPNDSIFNADIKNSRALLSFFKPLVEGLEEMHRHQIIHRDLSSRNLLLADGKLRLIDLGIAKRIHTDQPETEMLETSVSPYMPEEHQKHQLQDSRTDVYSLAKVMLEAYEKFNIPLPTNVKKILDKASSDKIQDRYSIEVFRSKLYGKNKNTFLILSLLCAFIMITIFHLFLYDSRQNTQPYRYNTDDYTDTVLQSEMIHKIEKACGHPVEEQYMSYTDFDADGRKEMFAFIPTETEESIASYEDKDRWINYGEVWFCDGKRTIMVDEIGMDDWQGGGYYEITLLQFGKVYHMQLCKFYGPLTLNQGPANVYAYENGVPVKTREGYINNPVMIDGGEDYGVYYTTCALKGSTQFTGRTWDKIYVYYRNGEYLAYESQYLELSELQEYENFEAALTAGIKKIYASQSMDFKENELKIISGTASINNKQIYVYQCKYQESTQYITLFNSYTNESGRIYLNLTSWSSKDDFLRSTIWDDDEWHTAYKSPVEVSDISASAGIGYNYYIIFKDRKSVLEMEEVNSGFWE